MKQNINKQNLSRRQNNNKRRKNVYIDSLLALWSIIKFKTVGVSFKILTPHVCQTSIYDFFKTFHKRKLKCLLHLAFLRYPENFIKQKFAHLLHNLRFCKNK